MHGMSSIKICISYCSMLYLPESTELDHQKPEIGQPTSWLDTGFPKQEAEVLKP
jgi:hypothetical protein